MALEDMWFNSTLEYIWEILLILLNNITKSSKIVLDIENDYKVKTPYMYTFNVSDDIVFYLMASCRNWLQNLDRDFIL